MKFSSYYTLLSIFVTGEIMGLIVIATADLSSTQRLWLISLAGAGVIAVAVLSAVFIYWRSKQIKQLISNTQRIKEGKFTNVSAMVGNNELTSINQQLEAIAKTIIERNQQLADSENNFQALVDNSPLPISISTLDGVAEYLNKQYTRTFGYDIEQVSNMRVWLNLAFPNRSYRNTIINQISQNFTAKTPNNKSQTEWKITCANGDVIDTEIHTALVGDRIVVIFNDITQRKKAEQSLRTAAETDAITGLANRYQLNKQLTAAIKSAKRSNSSIALLYLGLDRFKTINDTLGNQTGDSLLIAVAERLKELVRPNDLIARVGGDEFAVLIEGLPKDDQSMAEETAKTISHEFSMPFYTQNHELFAGASIGIATYPESGDNNIAIIKAADLAMHRAKDERRGGYILYSQQIRDFVLRRGTIENELRNALEKQQLQLYYQAKVDLTSEKISGFETLLRWEHPELGWISPEEFIPVAEETGMIVNIGRWVIEQCCHSIQEIGQTTGSTISMSANISAQQLKRQNIVSDIKKVLERNELQAGLLEMEITESSLIENLEESIPRLNEIHDLGIKISIDDFGTGYSSLQYLKKLPVQSIKIDKSFIDDITESEDEASIVKAVINLAKSLHLEVVAEGVETFEQAQLLKQFGCDIIQGYWLSKPIPKNDLKTFIQNFRLAQ